MNELDRLLELVTREAAYGAAFYDALLTHDVYALMLKGDCPRPEGRVRFVMWTGDDGVRVVPCFSNRAAVRRALTPQWQAVRLNGRILLEGCQGTTVVLNPNAPCFCRLTPAEITNLLSTGLPDAGLCGPPIAPSRVELDAPNVPEHLLHSLTVLLAHHPAVQRAYLLTCHYPELAAAICTVAAVFDAPPANDHIARAVASLPGDLGLTGSLDLIRLVPDESLTREVVTRGTPFYVRSVSTVAVQPTASVT